MTPMPWVCRWAGLIPVGGRVLDVACGNGRHTLYLTSRGYSVEAVDKALPPIAGDPSAGAGVAWRQYDLEAAPWPFGSEEFQGVVVTNYLFRPLFTSLIDALARGGVLIYATFSMGQERYGRPRNPQHLLMPGELLEVVRGHMRVVAYEDVLDAGESPARVQRLCAIKN